MVASTLVEGSSRSLRWPMQLVTGIERVVAFASRSNLRTFHSLIVVVAGKTVHSTLVVVCFGRMDLIGKLVLVGNHHQHHH